MKVASLVFSSTGEISYVPSRLNDIFFKLIKNKPLVSKISPLVLRSVLVLSPYIYIEEIPYMLIQQKKKLGY